MPTERKLGAMGLGPEFTMNKGDREYRIVFSDWWEHSLCEGFMSIEDVPKEKIERS